MSPGIVEPHIEREPLLLKQPIVPAGGSAGGGRLHQQIAGLLPDQGLGSLDDRMLMKLLQEGERVVANTRLLLRSAKVVAAMPATKRFSKATPSA